MRIIVISFLLLVVASCGPSDQQIQESAMQQMKQWIEQKGDLEEQLEKQEASLEANLHAYEDLIASIVAQKSKFQDIKGFKLLRTASEKEQQIKAQVKYIRELEAKVPEFEKVIREQQAMNESFREMITDLTKKIDGR
jgi:predicted metal-dependent hydrolase